MKKEGKRKIMLETTEKTIMKKQNLLKTLFYKIKFKLKRLFKKSEKSSYAIWIEKEIEFFNKRVSDVNKETKDEDDIFDKYLSMCADSAKELALLFEKQGHSGMSASITLDIFNNLAQWKPLSPITGEESEWIKLDKDRNELQNGRLTSLFKEYNEDGTVKYSDAYIIEVVNDSDVWKRYAESEDKIGTLDDDDPRVKKYFASVRKLKDELNSKITFPFIHVTHYYRWNFYTEELEEVTDMPIKPSN